MLAVQSTTATPQEIQDEFVSIMNSSNTTSSSSSNSSSTVSMEFKKILKNDLLGDEMIHYQPEIFHEIDLRVEWLVTNILQNKCQFVV